MPLTSEQISEMKVVRYGAGEAVQIRVTFDNVSEYAIVDIPQGIIELQGQSRLGKAILTKAGKYNKTIKRFGAKLAPETVEAARQMMDILKAEQDRQRTAFGRALRDGSAVILVNRRGDDWEGYNEIGDVFVDGEKIDYRIVDSVIHRVFDISPMRETYDLVPRGVKAGDDIGSHVAGLLAEREHRVLKAQTDRTAKIEQAKSTAQPVIIRSWTEDCDGSATECDIDHVTELALPDGSTTTRRVHTH